MASRIQMFLCAFLFLAVSAHADPITVTFTALPASGDPVNTGPSTGSFTFDSSLIPPGGGQLQNTGVGLPVTSINFAWSNTLWTVANAGVGELLFSPQGLLLGWVLGGKEGPTWGIYGYTVAPATAVTDDIFVSSFFGGGGIAYTNAGYEGSLHARVVRGSTPSPVPEPASILLCATGMGLIAARQRARRRGGRASAAAS